jgi:hypothetical protein
MMGREVSSRTYPEIGVPDAHHPLSHHEDDKVKIATMSKINTYHTTLFSVYLKKLRDTPDGDGSLLDHMVLIYGCGMSNSNSHSPINVPVLLLGGGSGQLKGNQHIKYEKDPPLANLMVTLLDKLGVPLEKIGNSNGRLPIEPLSGV